MLISPWFRPKKRKVTKTYQPALCQLEDRTVPSGFGGFFARFFPPPGPASHLEVIVPENVQSGRPFGVEVEALDASNRLATGYTGTVQISLATADAGATLPANYTFTKADHGFHKFTVTLLATGSQTIQANDTATGSTIAGSAKTTVNPAAVATQLMVITPEQATVGVPANVTVVALDASGHRVTNYTGTVTLTAANATVPASYTFVAADHGQHTFQVTFNQAAATETVSAMGVTTSGTTTTTLSASASLKVNAVGQVTHFGLFAFGPVITGAPVQVIVVALDASNQVVTGYTGTIHFTSSDTAATLPGDYQFSTTDKGIHVFTVTLATSGSQTLTVTDTSDSTITSSETLRVKSKPVPGWHFGTPGF